LITGVILLVVLVGAGAYFGASRIGDSGSRPDTTSPAQSSPNSQTSSVPVDGEVPPKYLGTWDSRIDNATGHHTRRLVIKQGEVGDTVLYVIADGPSRDGGTYHCRFAAELASVPADDGPLRIGPSTVTVAEPASACNPGGASTVTLLSDRTLQRIDGEQLTYTKSG
jgi:hypothetical protein